MAVTRQSFRTLRRTAWIAASALVALSAAGAAPAARGGSDTAIATGSVSGLPLPRFVSLKADRVNVRSGPNKDQDVRWIYTRAGMPVEITAEFENWRRIRDWEGAEGWVYHSLLSGKRTAVVVPKLNGVAGAALWQRGCQSDDRGPPAIRRAGDVEILHRQLVRIFGQEFRRLDPARPAVGRLSEREGGVGAHSLRFKRTTTSTRAIS